MQRIYITYSQQPTYFNASGIRIYIRCRNSSQVTIKQSHSTLHSNTNNNTQDNASPNAMLNHHSAHNKYNLFLYVYIYTVTDPIQNKKQTNFVKEINHKNHI